MDIRFTDFDFWLIEGERMEKLGITSLDIVWETDVYNNNRKNWERRRKLKKIKKL